MRIIRKDEERYTGRENCNTSLNDEKPSEVSENADLNLKWAPTAKHASQQVHPYHLGYRR
jgi:hypothetical protein